MLFVCDSVIAGFGRLGTWFGIERWGVRPDMLTFAKGVTSGYLPLGGVVVGAKVAAPFWEDGAWFRHGPTYSGHPTVCAAAMANLDIIEREGLLDRGRELEDEIAPALRPAGRPPAGGRDPHRDRRPGRDRLRAPRRWPRRPTCPRALFAALRERGVLLRPLGDGLAFSPALVITREQVEHVAEVAGEALEAVARDVPAAVGARSARSPRALAALRGAYSSIEGKGVAVVGARGSARRPIHANCPAFASDSEWQSGAVRTQDDRRATARARPPPTPSPR